MGWPARFTLQEAMWRGGPCSLEAPRGFTGGVKGCGSEGLVMICQIGQCVKLVLD